MKKFFIFLFSLLIGYLPALSSVFVNYNNIDSWYGSLQKPFFTPPNEVFTPVWMLLYFLIGLSFFLVLIEKPSIEKRKGLIFYLLQLILNGGWTVIFFGYHLITLAFVEIIFLLIFIILTIKYFYYVSKPAAYLLFPYAIWVSFAVLLNLGVMLLN